MSAKIVSLKEKSTVKVHDFCKIRRHIDLFRADANLVSALILTSLRISLSASELLLLSNCKYFVLEFIMNVDATRSSSVIEALLGVLGIRYIYPKYFSYKV